MKKIILLSLSALIFSSVSLAGTLPSVDKYAHKVIITAESNPIKSGKEYVITRTIAYTLSEAMLIRIKTEEQNMKNAENAKVSADIISDADINITKIDNAIK